MTSLHNLLDQVLGILGIPEDRGQSMVEEVEQVVQTKAIVLCLQTLPEPDRKRFGELPADKIEQLLRKHIYEAVIKQALMQATEEIIPAYIAELAKVANREQRSRIQELLDVPVAK